VLLRVTRQVVLGEDAVSRVGFVEGAVLVLMLGFTAPETTAEIARVRADVTGMGVDDKIGVLTGGRSNRRKRDKLVGTLRRDRRGRGWRRNGTVLRHNRFGCGR
jgi:hypothetical protein